MSKRLKIFYPENVGIDRAFLCFLMIVFAESGANLFPMHKKVFWIFNILSFFILPYVNFTKLTFKIRILVSLLLIVSIGVIIRGILDLNGQNIWSIIANPAFMLFEFLPLFILLSISGNTLYYIYNYLTYLNIGILFLFVFFNPLSIAELLVYFIGIFTLFNLPRYKFIIIIALVNGYIAFLINDHRIILIGLVFLLLILVVNKLNLSFNALKKFATIFVFVWAMLPLTLIFIGIKTGFSIYQIGDYLSIKSDRGLEIDTRTFLWYEVFKDLNNNDSLIFGKGLTGRVESVLTDEFDLSVTKKGRAFIEVRFLDILRRGGIIYCLMYYFIILFAVLNTILKTKNKFMLIVSMSIISFYVLNFIGLQPFFNFYSVVFWILIGMSFSSRWNLYTDMEIRSQLIKTPVKNKINFG